MPRLRNREPQSRDYILDALPGTPRPVVENPGGEPLSGGFDYPVMTFGPYRRGNDIQEIPEAAMKSGQIVTALLAGRLQRMPEVKPTVAPVRVAAPVPPKD